MDCTYPTISRNSSPRSSPHNRAARPLEAPQAVAPQAVALPEAALPVAPREVRLRV